METALRLDYAGRHVEFALKKHVRLSAIVAVPLAIVSFESNQHDRGGRLRAQGPGQLFADDRTRKLLGQESQGDEMVRRLAGGMQGDDQFGWMRVAIAITPPRMAILRPQQLEVFARERESNTLSAAATARVPGSSGVPRSQPPKAAPGPKVSTTSSCPSSVPRNSQLPLSMK